MIGLKETIAGSKSQKKASWEKHDFITYYIERPISYLLTWPLLNLGIGANAVSFFSILVSIGGLCFLCLGNTVLFKIIGWLLLFLWSILDCVDGNIARFRKTSGNLGELWDATAGYIAMFCLFFSSAFLATTEESVLLEGMIPDILYYLICGLSVMMCLVPRIVMHKKSYLCGNAEDEFKNRESFNLLKMLINNVMSITGIALFLLLPAIIFNFSNIYCLGYSSLNVLAGIYALIRLLRQ